MDLTSRCIEMKTVVHVLMAVLAKSQAHVTCQPKAEVVSIYRDDFKTLQPYFIKVTRCVQCDRCKNNPTSTGYAVPDHVTMIKAIVPDSASGLYNEYTIYNHTNCTCGAKNEYEKKLYGTMHRFDKAYYEANYKNNPNKVKDCTTPQPRLKLIGQEYDPTFYRFDVCLPFCKTVKRITKNISLVHKTTIRDTRQFTTSTRCDYQDGPNSLKQIPPANEKQRRVKEFPLSIYIGSPKVVLAAFLLALLLLTILIVDFTFCRRRRGFCYSLFNCKEEDMKRCTECKVEETVV